jgi:2-oxoisovalerate dehydrogenase E1 component beta subunit
MAETSYIDAITQAMQVEMARDERVFLIGEDVGAYGGAF